MLIIKNGRIVDPFAGRDAIGNILINDDGLISDTDLGTQRIGPIIAGRGDTKVIDASGMIVSPGFVDTHAHFRDPGFTEKETLHTGALAAARGGYTSVICMANTEPAVDRVEVLTDILDRAGAEKIRIYQAATVTVQRKGQALTDMEALAEAGAALFSDDGSPIMDEALVEKAMRKAADIDKVISFHEEDPAFIGIAGINSGAALKMGLRGAMAEAESTMVKRDAALALETGASITLQHLSSRLSVKELREAKERDAKNHIHAEVTPNHFSLTEDAVHSCGPYAKINPPLRTEEDREALIRALSDGIIDVIATDHAPHCDHEKRRALPEAPSGIIGLETALSLSVKNLILPGFLSISDFIRAISLNPARIYGLKGGSLANGMPADITVFSIDEYTEYHSFFSKSTNTPFRDCTLPGKVQYTIVGGRIVYDGCTNEGTDSALSEVQK